MYRSRDSIVGTETDYGLGDQEVGVRIPERLRIFSTLSRPVLGPTQPPIQWVLRVKQQGSEAGHSPAISVEVKKI
jgi:hypothetical protein